MLLTAVVALAGWVGHRLWPRSLRVLPGKPLVPAVEPPASRSAVRLPSRYLLADAGRYGDELFAYLMFDYVRGVVSRKGTEALLTHHKGTQGLVYTLRLHLRNDLLAAIPQLARWQVAGILPSFEWRWVTDEVLAHYRSQAQRMHEAYNLPARRELGRLNRRD
ncbi:MAG: hypothetical protein AAB654_04600 [Acidobacteriota bacterium]